jgi:uncharacterized protein YciI
MILVMLPAHVFITTAENYLTLREPHRQAHIARMVRLRAQGLVIGGGPTPDGRTAEVFYRASEPGHLERLVEDDPYYQHRVWTAYTVRTFSTFVEPQSQPPVVLDGSRHVTILEGPADDPDKAQRALIELRGAGRLAFGGLFGDGRTLAVVASDDARTAIDWLSETGLWSAGHLTARPLLYVL